VVDIIDDFYDIAVRFGLWASSALDLATSPTAPREQPS
jgi:hypothetical protein